MPAQILAVEHLAALVVNDVALLVHHVVVLEHALTGLEVAALDGFLRLLDGAGEHLMVKRRILVHAQSIHHIRHAFGAEQAHHVVGHGDEEAALAGVALTAGAAAELIVYTAGFMALGAEDVQSADGSDLLGLLGADLPVLLHALAEHCPRLEDFLIPGVGIAGGLGNDLIAEACLAQVVLCKIFGVAAEHDIRASSGHVGRDGDRAELACLSDDLRLLLMMLGV